MPHSHGKKRMLAEKATMDIRTVTTDFLAIASGVPIKEAWTQGSGRSFQDILMRLGSDPSPQSVLEARTALYTDALTVLIESWEKARDAENLSRQLQINIDGIPTSRRRCDEWKAERPTNLTVELDLPHDRLPETSDTVFQLSAKYRDWVSRWKYFWRAKATGTSQTQPGRIQVGDRNTERSSRPPAVRGPEDSHQ